MQKSKSLIEFLEKHKEQKSISFHMPGHKGLDLYKKLGYGPMLEELVDLDITEIPGADNLFQAEGVIESLQKKYQELYQVRKSYLLVNGSSSGIIASILAVTSKGDQVIIARNSHKSIFAALALGGLKPIYISPKISEEFGISGQISPERIKRAILENPKVKAVVLPSPNYYGVCSDIRAISQITREQNKILIVDQAHGAHLKFINRELSAEEQGADLIINSTHKTLASFTQTALLNVNSNKINLYELEEKLQWIQTTSPSYILMASLEINARILDEEQALLEEWKENIEWFYVQAQKISGLKIMEQVEGLDKTKINIDLSYYNISGKELEEKLIARNIFPELFTGNILMLMTGIGTTKAHLESLLRAIEEIVLECAREKRQKVPATLAVMTMEFVGIGKEKELVNFTDSEGRICATCITPYPPGIPLVCPGEKISKEAILYAGKLREEQEKVVGIDKENKIAVYK